MLELIAFRLNDFQSLIDLSAFRTWRLGWRSRLHRIINENLVSDTTITSIILTGYQLATKKFDHLDSSRLFFTMIISLDIIIARTLFPPSLSLIINNNNIHTIFILIPFYYSVQFSSIQFTLVRFS